MGRHKTIGLKQMSREEYNAYYREANKRKRDRDRKPKVERTHKACTTCNKVFPITEEFFYRSKTSALGRPYFHSWCKACVNRYNVSRKFKITPEQYDRIVSKHCDICWSGGGKRGLHIDHCHATGRIRGALCICCNTAIGSMRNRPDLLRRAAEYLEDRS